MLSAESVPGDWKLSVQIKPNQHVLPKLDRWILNILIWSFRKKEMGAALCCSGPGRCRKELGRLSISIIMPAPQLVSCIMGIVMGSMIMMVVKMRMFEIMISIIMSAPQLVWLYDGYSGHCDHVHDLKRWGFIMYNGEDFGKMAMTSFSPGAWWQLSILEQELSS